LFRQTLDEQIKMTSIQTPSEIKYSEYIQKMRDRKLIKESPMSVNLTKRNKTLRFNYNYCEPEGNTNLNLMLQNSSTDTVSSLEIEVEKVSRINKPEGQHLVDLTPGHYFGQSALHSVIKPRQAHVFALENSVVLVIDRNNFNKLLQENAKRRESQLLAELKILPLLQNFTYSQLKKIVQSFQPVKRLMHQFLYKEKDPAKFVYIVKEGEFRQTIKMTLPN
jgi:CRP-like cAMP-binding protein